MIFFYYYIFSLSGLNSGSNTSRLFKLAGSDLAPSSLIAHWLSRKYPLRSLLLQWALAGSLPARCFPPRLPWQQCSTEVLRGLELTSQRWSLSSCLQSTMCWSVFLRERAHSAGPCFLGRWQAPGQAHRHKFGIGYWITGPNMGNIAEGEDTEQRDPRPAPRLRTSWPVLQRKRKPEPTAGLSTATGKILFNPSPFFHSN